MRQHPSNKCDKDNADTTHDTHVQWKKNKGRWGVPGWKCDSISFAFCMTFLLTKNDENFEFLQLCAAFFLDRSSLSIREGSGGERKLGRLSWLASHYHPTNDQLVQPHRQFQLNLTSRSTARKAKKGERKSSLEEITWSRSDMKANHVLHLQIFFHSFSSQKFLFNCSSSTADIKRNEVKVSVRDEVVVQHLIPSNPSSILEHTTTDSPFSQCYARGTLINHTWNSASSKMIASPILAKINSDSSIVHCRLFIPSDNYSSSSAMPCVQRRMTSSTLAASKKQSTNNNGNFRMEWNLSVKKAKKVNRSIPSTMQFIQHPHLCHPCRPSLKNVQNLSQEIYRSSL